METTHYEVTKTNGVTYSFKSLAKAKRFANKQSLETITARHPNKQTTTLKA